MHKRRIFLAIPFPKAYAHNLSMIQSNLALILSDKVRTLRSIPEENLHITLLFIGDCLFSKMNEIALNLQDLFHEISGFELSPQSITLGPPGESPCQIWLTFKDNPNFSNLQNASFSAIKDICDLKPPKTIIHSTLMKFPAIKTESLIDVSVEIEVSPLTVRKIVLFSSQLQQQGAKYSHLHSFDLKK